MWRSPTLLIWVLTGKKEKPTARRRFLTRARYVSRDSAGAPIEPDSDCSCSFIMVMISKQVGGWCLMRWILQFGCASSTSSVKGSILQPHSANFLMALTSLNIENNVCTFIVILLSFFGKKEKERKNCSCSSQAFIFFRNSISTPKRYTKFSQKCQGMMQKRTAYGFPFTADGQS